MKSLGVVAALALFWTAPRAEAGGDDARCLDASMTIVLRVRERKCKPGAEAMDCAILFQDMATVCDPMAKQALDEAEKTKDLKVFEDATMRSWSLLRGMDEILANSKDLPPDLLTYIMQTGGESLNQLSKRHSQLIAGAPDRFKSPDPKPQPEPKPPDKDKTLTDARQEEKMAGETGSKDPKAYEKVADKFLEGGSAADAERAARKSVELSPNDASGHALLGAALLGQGDYPGALKSVEAALARDPENKRAREMAAYLKSAAAPKGFKKNLRPPEFGESRVALEGARGGDVAAGEGRMGGRAGAEGAARPRVPASGQTAMRQAELRIKMGDLRGALIDATRAIDQDRKNPAAWVLRAKIANLLKNPAGALADAEEALRLSPDDAAALRERAYAYFGLGRYQEAFADADRAVRLDPDNALGYLLRAMAEEKLGRTAESLADYEEAARRDPSLLTLLEEARLRLGVVTVEAPRARGLRRDGFRTGALALAAALIGLGLVGVAVVTRRRRTSRSAAPAAEVDTLKPGSVIGGNFQIIRELGRGGMGVVHEAMDLTLKRRVAVKQMRRELAAEDKEREFFLKEARVAAAFKHPNLAEIYSVVADGGLFLVFEFVEGRTLADLLSARGKLAADEALGILRQVCAALEYAHSRKVIHRDIKPANVMIAADGAVKVMDFGIAHQASATTGLTMTGPSGTPQYMAPEQAMGSACRQSDLYALGVMTFEMLTGGPPFRDSSDPPAGLRDFFERALQDDPLKRYSTAGEFLDALISGLGESRP